MRFIYKKPTFESLRALQQFKAEHRNKASWETFQNPGKRLVRLSILKEQGYICAYCMREIDENAQIEHWEAQESSKVKKKLDDTVKYENLLAVCAGGKQKNKNSNNLHCDSSRSNGNRSLTIKPTVLSTLSSIKYLANGRIEADCSCKDESCKNSCIHCDMNCKNGLNLNLLSLQDERQQVLSNIRKSLDFCSKKNGKDLKTFKSQRQKIILNAIGNEDKYKPYCGMIEFFYKKHL